MHWIFGILFLLYVIIDVNYFLANIFVILSYILRRKRICRSLLDVDSSWGICFPSDLDHMLHMNNAKYLRAFEFARAAFGLNNNFWVSCRDIQATVLVSSQVIRYRKPVFVFQCYNILTKVAFWEGRDLYVEQQLITTSDKFVRATCLVKLTLVNGDMDKLLKVMPVEQSLIPKTVPTEVGHFRNYNEANSSKHKPPTKVKDT